MDPIPCVSVDATHPAVTAARRRSGKAAMERQTPVINNSHGLPRVNDWLRNWGIIAIIWRGI